MSKSTPSLSELLSQLQARARARSLSDTAWAQRAGVRKETLSRLRRRDDCDLSTLQALANAVDASLRLGETAAVPIAADGHFPAAMDRAYEARLLALASTGTLEPAQWEATGPRFFMAGLATMLAGRRGPDRPRLLELAERLHPGITEPAVFARWLERSPLRPSRFLPLLEMEERRHAA